jgi:hypothetical protein
MKKAKILALLWYFLAVTRFAQTGGSKNIKTRREFLPSSSFIPGYIRFALYQ